MRIKALFAVFFLTCSGAAAEPMTPEQFERYTTGKTLFYGQNGRLYGAEEYLSNRRVRWSFLDGECQDGRWYPVDNEICFVYEGKPEPQCWIFSLGIGGLRAEFQDENPGPDLYEAQDTGEELICLGPKIGV